MRDVAVGPGDVDSGVAGDMDYDAGGLAACMEWDGHEELRNLQLSVYR